MLGKEALLEVASYVVGVDGGSVLHVVSQCAWRANYIGYSDDS